MLASLKGKSHCKLKHVEVGQMFATSKAQTVAAVHVFEPSTNGNLMVSLHYLDFLLHVVCAISTLTGATGNSSRILSLVRRWAEEVLVLGYGS